jgi:hypothetical protein
MKHRRLAQIALVALALAVTISAAIALGASGARATKSHKTGAALSRAAVERYDGYKSGYPTLLALEKQAASIRLRLHTAVCCNAAVYLHGIAVRR